MERTKTSSHTLLFFTLCLLIGATIVPATSSFQQSPSQNQKTDVFDGQILFAPWYSTTTYLMDSSGKINHTWPSSYQPFTEAYWMGDGSIMRPIAVTNAGGIQRINWDGSLAWDYRYTVSGCTCHHDIKVLPNGNVMMIVWVTKTRQQAIQAGRNPSTVSGNFIPDKIIEIKQTGPTSGDVVWEWNVWDHLIQDFDATKDNYGDVSEHPELVDINFGDSFIEYDWLHTNSLDYDPQFDTLLVDSHNFDEVWVIDHSTTTEEAAGHTGGHYGHGGDLLYRWGNPQSYRRGTASDEILFGQHSAVWIKPGYPGAGDIMVFNNGYNRPGNPKYSTVDEFTPPIDNGGNYYLAPGEAYGPENLTWRYEASPASSMYSQVFGGALRLMDGNTLICTGVPGKFLEVTPDDTVIWQYQNAYPSPSHPDVFKIDYVTPQEPPSQPVITGPATTTTGLVTTFNVTAADPNGDQVYYFVNWGDSTNSSWLGPVSSGQVFPVTHSWSKAGQYSITAKAKDSAGNEGGWSSPYIVTVGGADLSAAFVSSGIGVSATIQNVGTLDATNVSWKLQVTGGLLGRINKVSSGVVDIPVGNTTTIGTGMFFGFGAITAKVTVAGATTSAQGFYFIIRSKLE